MTRSTDSDLLINYFINIHNYNVQLVQAGGRPTPMHKSYQSYFEKSISQKNKKEVEMVIARYEESIHWTSQYKHLRTIYNKGSPLPERYQSITLPNVGRESHTYLTHIVKNWDNLAKLTFFTQGQMSHNHYPYHLPLYLLHNQPILLNLREKGIEFRNRPGGFLQHRKKWKQEYQSGKMKVAELPFDQWWEKYLHNTPPPYSQLLWSHGAIFSVHRNLIKQRPKEDYQQLLDCVSHHVNPEEGHYLERCWFYLFTTKGKCEEAVLGGQSLES